MAAASLFQESLVFLAVQVTVGIDVMHRENVLRPLARFRRLRKSGTVCPYDCKSQ
jgi:ABC-type uncharacterized transport system ATPase subunit